MDCPWTAARGGGIGEDVDENLEGSKPALRRRAQCDHDRLCLTEQACVSMEQRPKRVFDQRVSRGDLASLSALLDHPRRRSRCLDLAPRGKGALGPPESAPLRGARQICTESR